MQMQIAARVTVNRFPEIAAQLPRETSLVVRKTAFDVEKVAKVLAPFDTGVLKNSIHVEMAPGAQRATVGTNVEYAPYQEHGTIYMEPNPFLTPAAEMAMPNFVNAMRQLEARLR